MILFADEYCTLSAHIQTHSCKNTHTRTHHHTTIHHPTPQTTYASIKSKPSGAHWREGEGEEREGEGEWNGLPTNVHHKTIYFTPLITAPSMAACVQILIMSSQQSKGMYGYPVMWQWPPYLGSVISNIYSPKALYQPLHHATIILTPCDHHNMVTIT